MYDEALMRVNGNPDSFTFGHLIHAFVSHFFFWRSPAFKIMIFTQHTEIRACACMNKGLILGHWFFLPLLLGLGPIWVTEALLPMFEHGRSGDPDVQRSCVLFVGSVFTCNPLS